MRLLPLNTFLLWALPLLPAVRAEDYRLLQENKENYISTGLKKGPVSGYPKPQFLIKLLILFPSLRAGKLLLDPLFVKMAKCWGASINLEALYVQLVVGDLRLLFLEM